jgi:hypothetical protein
MDNFAKPIYLYEGISLLIFSYYPYLADILEPIYLTNTSFKVFLRVSVGDGFNSWDFQHLEGCFG